MRSKTPSEPVGPVTPSMTSEPPPRVVRVGEAVGMAELVQDDGEGEAALIEALLREFERSQPPLSTLNTPMPCWVP